MQTQFSDASGAQDAPEKHGRSVSKTVALQPAFKHLKTGIKLFLLVFTLALTTTSCVKNGDDTDCGDELNPCDEIVTDDIYDL